MSWLKTISSNTLSSAMESTGFIWVHLANFYLPATLLAPFSVRVYCLNPKEVKNYKKSFNDIGKNDGIDSFVIADFARVGTHQHQALARLLSILPCSGWPDIVCISLNVLQGRRLICWTTSSWNSVSMPCFGMGSTRFQNKYGATAEAILTEYTTNDDIVTSSIEELVAFH